MTDYSAPRPTGGYSAPGPGDYSGRYSGPPVQARNGLGVAALVLGILSLPAIFTIFLGIILGLLAVIFGLIGMGRAKRGEATNRGMAIAGVVTGAIGLVVSVVFIAVGVSFLFSHKTQINNLTQCIQNAHTTQAQTDCQNQFSNQLGH